MASRRRNRSYSSATNKFSRRVQEVATTPVAGRVQLWEILAGGALLYFGYKTISGKLDAGTAELQASKAGSDANTRTAITLYSAMVPGAGSTDTDTVLNLSNTISDFNGVADAYKNLYQRVLSDDLAKYLKAADVQTFMQNIANANQNQGSMNVNDEATIFYSHLHPVIPDWKQDWHNLMQDALDIHNSGASNPMSVYQNIVTAYKAKYGADLEDDISEGPMINWISNHNPNQDIQGMWDAFHGMIQDGGIPATATESSSTPLW